MIEGAEKLGTLAAEVMEMIDEAEVEDGCKVTVRTVAVVVELCAEEDDGPGFTAVRYRCSDPRRWVQQGFFDAAKRAVADDEGGD